MKRILTVLAALCLFLLLAACGGKTPENDGAPTGTPAGMSAAEVTESAASTEETAESPSDAGGEELDEGLAYKIENGEATVWCQKRNLKKLTVPRSIMGCPVTSVADNGFKNMAKLRQIVLPEGLKTIGYAAFANCYELQSVTLPESLTEIGEEAFAYCSGLQTVKIGHQLEKLPFGCFRNCTSLKEIDIPEGVKEIKSAFLANMNTVVHLTARLPDSLERMYSGFSFSDERSTLTLEIASIDRWFSISGVCEWYETVQVIRDEEQPELGYETVQVQRRETTMRVNCRNVTLIAGGAEVNEAYLPEGMTEFPDYCYYGVSSIRKAVIPEGITRLGVGCFAYTGVEEFEFPASLAEISDNALSGSRAELLVIPGTVKTVSRMYGMPYLNYLEVGDGVAVFDGFENCPRLTKAILPTTFSVSERYILRDRQDPQEPKTIDGLYISSLFTDCPRLTDVTFRGEHPLFVSIGGTVLYRDLEALRESLRSDMPGQATHELSSEAPGGEEKGGAAL